MSGESAWRPPEGGYVPVFRSILRSMERDARHLLLDLLLLADQDGHIDYRLAAACRVLGWEREAFDDAMRVLSGPDPESRSQAEDGRAVVPHSSGHGYQIVNHGLYREHVRSMGQRAGAAERKRRQRERDAAHRAELERLRREHEQELEDMRAAAADQGRDRGVTSRDMSHPVTPLSHKGRREKGSQNPEPPGSECTPSRARDPGPPASPGPGGGGLEEMLSAIEAEARRRGHRSLSRNGRRRIAAFAELGADAADVIEAWKASDADHLTAPSVEVRLRRILASRDALPDFSLPSGPSPPARPPADGAAVEALAALVRGDPVVDDDLVRACVPVAVDGALRPVLWAPAESPRQVCEQILGDRAQVITGDVDAARLDRRLEYPRSGAEVPS